MKNEGYDFGFLLKELREKAKLTQKQLGNKIGVSEGMISRYENNISEPSFDMVRSLAVIFNVSIDYLAGMNPNTISTVGLTDEQTNLLTELSNLFRKTNSIIKNELTVEYELLGKIVRVMFNR